MELRRWLRRVASWATLWAVVSAVGPARGYEFEVRARTFGQGYSLRSFRLLGPSPRLERRRFTQVLSLSLYDLGELRGPRRGRALYERALGRGPRIDFVSYLRIDHDDGPWSTGDVQVGNRVWDAVDLVPELEEELLDLDLLYAYVSAEGLAGGALDLRAGRQLRTGALDWWSLDGVAARVHAPPGLGTGEAIEAAVELFGGVRVRAASPVASSTTEPDGTGGADCAEYVEGATPGSGAWRPIDRVGPVGPGRGFDNDYDRCPQREQLMPTFGGAVDGGWERPGRIATWARVEYRRALSRRPGLIGPADRFSYPDLGLYPNELGQASGWGVNEELVAATLRAELTLADGRAGIGPYAAARYDLLGGGPDQAHAGVRVRYGAHAIEPEVYYSAARFDGDSIFQVFGVEPFTDLRLTYDVRPAALPVSAYARAWGRRYRAVRGGEDDALWAPAAWTGGVHAGLGLRPRPGVEARLDLFHEDGAYGRRSGAYLAGRWQVTPATGVRARASLVDLDEDPEAARASSLFVLRDTAAALQAGASVRINTGVRAHLMVEQHLSRHGREQVRIMALVDLAFLPEGP
ncbi:hypothetical protein [Haliangium sp.]|uniref:hypothetical protein n=1 Tax=Haliangium sp. TaxID=2663208 RepID=UPI003D112317